MIKIFLTALQDKNHAMNILDQKRNISMHLAGSKDYNEVADDLVQFVHAYIPSSDVLLYMNEYGKNRLDLAAPIGSFGQELGSVQAQMDVEVCRSCTAQHPVHLHSLAFCKQMHPKVNAGTESGYCLPLVYGKQPVGLLHLSPPEHLPLAAQQVEMLENVVEEMSGALGIAIEKKIRTEIQIEQTINAVQLDIARDLHDTIGQNISYLRLKLEQFEEAEKPHKVDFEAEMRHMSDVANESYDLVRGTLAVLQSGSSASLLNLLAGHARAISERTNLSIDFASQGSPRPLPPRIIRQLSFIFRETLSNIEEHANAAQVYVEIGWGEQELILQIYDDGRGFDPNIPVNNHFGLIFMRERTEKLNGSFSICSSIGAGTTITIRLPLD